MMMICRLRAFFIVGCIAALALPVAGKAENASRRTAFPPQPTSPSAGQAAASQPPASTAPASSAPRLLAQRFDDWIWRCSVPADAGPSCEIAQSVRVSQDGKAVDILNLAVSRANDKAGKVEWALIVLTPLDVHLPSDFALTIGGDKSKIKPIMSHYRNCNHLGCFVVTPLDAATINSFKQAQEGAGFFRLLNGKTVKVVFSLKGFDKALDGLTSKTLPSATAGAAPASTASSPAPIASTAARNAPTPATRQSQAARTSPPKPVLQPR